ncbi:MAG: carbohydrate kinase family protein [bacterium]|nr:carbohydrate kinase family protein [bacterium]
MLDIIAVGSATKDIFLDAKDLQKHDNLVLPLGEKIELKNIRYFSGGGGLNAATTFALQGLKTGFCGVLGQDLAGQEIIDELNKKGIDASMVRVKSREKTDIGLILHAQIERTILLFHGASRTLNEKDIDWQGLKNAKWLYLAPLWEQAAALTEKLVNFAYQNKVKIALNPSLDQLVLKNIGQILEKIDVLILNDDEASFLTGIKPFKEKAIFQKLAPNCLTPEVKHYVVVTRGKKGALACDGKFIYNVPAPLVKVVDATGAGDSFGSGFVAGLTAKHGRSDLPRIIERALKLAMSNAISNILVVGANQGLLKKGQPLLKIKVRKRAWSA